jgi:TrwC relaxase
VVADIAKLSVGREAYYTRELATDHEAYLSGHGESPGRWYGAGATSLGLQGEASPAGFQRMFEGRHPDTGELLGRPHGRNAVPGLDEEPICVGQDRVRPARSGSSPMRICQAVRLAAGRRCRRAALRLSGPAAGTGGRCDGYGLGRDAVLSAARHR